ncbi:MAG TPA: redox-regulated ATPase YchF [Candidatus Nanoarchaeia archaeon]|nr:redox-regulated ATPase YchF [Candidatus Nanoarchaeia archaeon]
MIIGLVGKPSSGKSTFFKATTLAEVEIANYPFTTIEKNEGVGFVKVKCADKEFNVRCNPRFGYCLNGIRFIPVQLIDVAGLVPEAHLGKGRGLAFLNDLNQADALIHIVDASGSLDAEGNPVESGSYDPANDIRFLEIELDHWYLSILKKGWEKFARKIRQEHGSMIKALGEQLGGLKVNEKMVEETVNKLKLPEDFMLWDDSHLLQLSTELRKRTKPMVIACNKIDCPGAEERFSRLKKEFPDLLLVPCSGIAELMLKEAARDGIIEYIPGEGDFKMLQEEKLSEKQKKGFAFIREMLGKFHSTGVQDVLNIAVFELLGCIAIFPGGVNKLEDKDGNILPDCFILPRNTTALDFAFHIHTDLGKNFVKAIDVRRKLPVGKDHLLKHRDVIEIKTSK